ncbi:hypothetical protein H0A36_11075 [Endozoicomonas sp. SM1973]|uniref:DUF1127 domain-containing protein n=1 Tax=Spartinivicinus marinus TaxID=2994442 RepID=A0A853HXR9_9GAMM|nr:hypothetical protein [Spartinivicinus marinus]MCX4026067.1 hypothetical protein [Spartinivicinus marinus]NYZ66550.1 hypothetical protein [Spartinivicinus marinus]
MNKHEPSQLSSQITDTGVTPPGTTKVSPSQLISIIKSKLQEHRKMKRCEHVFNQLTDKELRDLGFYRYGNRFFPLDD